MIDELASCIPSFSGQAHHVCCFVHIVNLVAKSLLKQFDAPRSGSDNDAEGSGGSLLQELAAGIDLEDAETRIEEADSEADTLTKDSTDGLVDILVEMSTHE